MSEKVLQEIRFIETDDGFRIEAKGDKEQLKAMGFGPGMFGFGRRFGRKKRHGAHRHHRPGPRMRRRMWHMHNQWHHEHPQGFGQEGFGTEKPPKDV
ncbi:MAG: hypothetical protein M9928_14140 [Anaerolineae bacterium]|nr:hypothetical protein [Anaerolineae bacterium]MCO5193859.1 hypothetical protein [Anaerolineae bacterium]MCO5197966.1 hypothetical protein [Anaerolineae bacterium]MCO5206170.1 hypothetical protein [Anaerolineae bacterium]